jgi:phosphoribosylamine--glycine ligase
MFDALLSTFHKHSNLPYHDPTMASKKTNILILGSGGREHVLGWKLKQSPSCGKLYFAPGNGGTSQLGENLKIDPEKVDTKTVDEIDYFCRHNDVSMIIIGPEDPLAKGMADRLAKEGRTIFGPNMAAARLEGDKAWAKQMMRAASIPTAEAKIVDNYEAAVAYIESREGGMVVKAAGLAKGKGVYVCDNQQEALAAIEDIMGKKIFGDAGVQVVIEEKLQGQELSVLALVDGRNIYVLEPAQDHKQAYEGDKGPNTGGMGAYTPTPLATDKLLDQVQRDVLVPTVDILKRDGIDFKGVLYAGLMLTPAGPKVLEFNVRFGDPEVQAMMMRLKGDLVDILKATAEGRLDQVSIDWDKRCCCCVVMASGGYPGDYQKGKVIKGLKDAEAMEDVVVFHAGTKAVDGEVLTAGGRVLNVCAMGKDIKEAQAKANAACEKIHFEGAQYRKDIGYRVMK